MTWLLLEILAFIVAAAAFGVLIGLGLSAAGANRKAVGYERAHQGLLDQLQALEQSQRAIEVKAEARSAAETAVRGDLEGRLLEIEATAAEYRARAEAAERQMRIDATPDYTSPVLVEPAGPPVSAADKAEIESLKAALAAAEARRGKAELDLRQSEIDRDAAQTAAAAAASEADAARARGTHEIESLGKQLAAAERVRAKSEAELAMAHARAEAVMRSAAALMGAAANPQSPSAPIWDPPLPSGAAHGDTNGTINGNGNGNGAEALAASAPMPDERDRPPALAAPRGGRPDDLRRIRGIGLRNEGVLNALGLYHYEQIAELSERHVTWLDAYFRFPGRIGREDWVGQAKALVAARGRTGHADKVHPEDAGF